MCPYVFLSSSLFPSFTLGLLATNANAEVSCPQIFEAHTSVFEEALRSKNVDPAIAELVRGDYEAVAGKGHFFILEGTSIDERVFYSNLIYRATAEQHGNPAIILASYDIRTYTTPTTGLAVTDQTVLTNHKPAHRFLTEKAKSDEFSDNDYNSILFSLQLPGHPPYSDSEFTVALGDPINLLKRSDNYKLVDSLPEQSVVIIDFALESYFIGHPSQKQLKDSLVRDIFYFLWQMKTTGHPVVWSMSPELRKAISKYRDGLLALDDGYLIQL